MYLDRDQGALMNQIAQQRKLLNISQAELAGKLDSGPSRISNFEASIRKPNLKTCWVIVNAINELGDNCTFEQVFPNPKQNSNETI